MKEHDIDYWMSLYGNTELGRRLLDIKYSSLNRHGYDKNVSIHEESAANDSNRTNQSTSHI
jgi:hypothetical protein